MATAGPGMESTGKVHDERLGDAMKHALWKIPIAALCGATILSVACAQQAQPNVTTALDTIFQRFNRPDGAGCAIGISREGAAPILRGYGSADLEHDVPFTPDSVSEAGSVSKQFTSASVLLLADQGKLKLTDDIRKYLPEMPDYGTPITINELLGHTSGLRDWGSVEAIAGWPRSTRTYTNTEALDIAARQKHLNYKPGTEYSYTNTGYNLLAIIVERVSGRSLAQFSREHLFVPLKMTHTQWRDDFQRIVKGRAIGYEPTKDGSYRQDMPFEDIYGNGGLLTTVGDLLRWNDALTNSELGTFVSTEIRRSSQLNDGRTIPYARGLFNKSYRGMSEISHSGATAGYRAWLARFSDQNLSIAILCNAGEANPVALGYIAADLFLRKTAAADRKLVAAPAEQLARNVGLYFDANTGSVLQVEVRGGALHAASGPALSPISPTEFTADGTTFRFDGNKLSRMSDSETAEYRRVQPWTPQAAELESFVGEYESDEALAVLEVRMTSDKLLVVPEDRRSAAATMTALFADTFRTDNGMILHFRRSAKGEITGFDASVDRVYSLAFRLRK
jgi:CubicO group peptidase (beta-lactamase class C family)